MKTSAEHRSSDRVPIANRVKVMSNGKIVAYLVAINLSMGGILLSAQPNLRVGSSYDVAIQNGVEGAGVLAKGVVVRNDDHGTAVQFASQLPKSDFETVATAAATPRFSFLDSYRNYFQVSRSRTLENCEELLGVTKTQFRRVFYSTFSGSIVLAVLPVWLLRASIPPYPNIVKILLAFAWGALWFALLQPSMDLGIFRVLRGKAARHPAS
jgi:hypothetical protein